MSLFDPTKIICKDCTRKNECVVFHWVFQKDMIHNVHFVPDFEVLDSGEKKIINCEEFKFEK